MDKSPLNTLPAELRNRIYELAIPRSRKIFIRGTYPKADDINQHHPGFQPPALLQVCRHIRSEARGIYFGQNLFVVASEDCGVHARHPGIARWLRSLSSGSRALIRHVRLWRIRFLPELSAKTAKDSVATCRAILASERLEIDEAKITSERRGTRPCLHT